MPREITKEKIAISIDRALLSAVDSRVDGISVRNRSQAIESLLRRAMNEAIVRKAVLLLKAEHIPLALREVGGKRLIRAQHEFLLRNGITKILVLTNPSGKTAELRKAVSEISPSSEVLEQAAKGNAAALFDARSRLGNESFVVMDGDTLMDFDLAGMIKRHLEKGRLLTMGLIQSPIAERYTSVNLDGDSVKEINRKKHGLSRVIDAGIYVMRPEVFGQFPKNARSLAGDVFPKLVEKGQVLGHFTFGAYRHVGV